MIRSRKSIIDRRTVLRGSLAAGVGVALPLPRLLGMLNDDGNAYAQGEPLPARFGTWFFGNGITPSRWVPAATGEGDAWALSEQLSPLASVKDYLTLVTGLEIKIPNMSAHKSHPACVLTGAQSAADVQAPSIDQLVAGIIGSGTVYPSGLHVGISNTTGAGALDFNISFNGPSAPNPPEYDPVVLFKKLLQFSDKTAEVDPTLLRRKRVLDAVAEDAKALRSRLGSEDQQRLDRHLSGVGELQNQLDQAALPRACGVLVDPDVAYADRGKPGAITRQRGQAFADLLVFALSCDLTRVFSYVFTCAACHGSYKDAGLEDVTFHEDYGHRESPKGADHAEEGFTTGVKYAMTNLCDLLERMKATPDGAGNLLDNSCVYVTSCTGESVSHGNKDYPLLSAGRAGGALKTNVHQRMEGESSSLLPFTLLKAMGYTEPAWGMAEARVTNGIDALLTP
jgi:hypothetical protein